jgi:hypothetical protein
VLTSAAKLKGAKDPCLALAFSAMLLALAQPDAHPAFLSSKAAAVLADQLLQVGCWACWVLLGLLGLGPGLGPGAVLVGAAACWVKVGCKCRGILIPETDSARGRHCLRPPG